MIKILAYTMKNPLECIGELSGICWGADTSNYVKNIRRAWDCINSGHGRTEEFPDVYCVIDGYSAAALRELYTHIGGSPTRLQASTRYIDYEKKGIEVVTPHSIEKVAEAKEIWDKAIKSIKNAMSELKAIGSIPNEDITKLLPLAYKSKMVWKVNLRTLVNFFGQRKCFRAYFEIRELCDDFIKALSDYSDEWKTICDALFVSKCEQYKFINPNFCFCMETKGCGKYINIKELKIVKNN